MDAVKIMADEKSVISYRPRFNKHTGSVLATILLQQAAYWWCKMGEQPYYKFKEPCNAPQYRDGESWCEELGFSRREFDTACTMLEERGFIHKKTDMSRLTWYTVSQEKISEMMDLVCGSRKGGNALYVKAESAVTYRRKTPLYNGGKRLLTIQENTHKTTSVDQAAPIVADTPKKKSEKFDQLAALMAYGCSEQLAKDWLQVRKDKDSPSLTLTALARHERQAAKAGITPMQAVQVCVEKEWRGFTADWNWSDTSVKPNSHTTPSQTNSSSNNGYVPPPPAPPAPQGRRVTPDAIKKLKESLQ